MSRSRRAAVAAIAAGLALGACLRPPTGDPLTFVVTRARFVHRVRAEGHLRATRTTVIPVSPKLQEGARIAWLAPDGSQVRAGDLVARLDPTQMKERLVDGGLDLDRNQLERDRARITGDDRVLQTEKDRELAALELDVARRYQRTDAEVFSRFQIVESEIDATLAQERGEHAERMRDVHLRLADAEAALLETERRKVEIVVERARRGLETLEVRAPHPGLLLLSRNHQGDILQVGAQVWRGHPLGEIPDLAAMEAEVFVLETDAGGLAVGRPATVTLAAHPETSFDAVVRRVDAVARSKDRGSPVQYFAVSLALEGPAHQEIMKPGLRVEATLDLAELDGVVVVPRQAISIEEGEARVWVREQGRFAPRSVEIGAQSVGRAVVTSGLEPGDEVALAPPGEPPS